MTNNREILSLGNLAYEALLLFKKNRGELVFSEAQHTVFMQYAQDNLRKKTPLLLQYIADARLDSVKKLLEENPEYAVAEYSTLTTSSGNTYENVTGIQLTYLMDDVEMCNMMMPYISQLSKPMQKKAYEQLATKMAEVKNQAFQFESYNFSTIVQAITDDQTLKQTGKANAETEKAFAQFKKDLGPRVIQFGKSWIKSHLQEGYRVFKQNWELWQGRQLKWFMINIIGFIQCGVEKCCELEFSQGLKEIVDEGKPLNRDIQLTNDINDTEMTYRGSIDSQLLLGRDYFVDIYYGTGGCSGVLRPGKQNNALRGLDSLCAAEEKGMEDFLKFCKTLSESVEEDFQCFTERPMNL